MSTIVVISGSPSTLSRSERVLYYLGELAEQQGFRVKHISVRDVEAEDLLYANFQSPKIKEIAGDLEAADGVIVGSPVYKASYSGILKSLFDLMPQDVLRGTVSLPVMTGGSLSHLLALDYALKPLLATLKSQPLKGLYFQDSEVDKTKDNPILDEAMITRTHKQLDYFLGNLKRKEFV
ncbi:NAD(P)H-dependent FMN reductase [Oceanobacillus oncorhynchi subsp. incaldanensis]|uniref:FMN reductase (NADPH) n=1 Tax=Oceanobacillus oncorhynchi TaxID=545501 RepID=A0A0A1MS48_9BACI|nr:NADPH-dependent FMN reductase [Oceanobacillus oncorhynchi]MDM8102654.1 NADPH-dependent FMN reductase [Oceanobacillus oncorhynchi]GIO21332.1 NAD(P)H-dependent FMN reductase [Oceanobacillus oncorhynchi subsp. incaldanensis]CEI82529.1 FMN reductase (NADPH) [Oceanobacillus oncorhynchi]